MTTTEPSASAAQFSELARRLAEASREFHRRGWALGASGNCSAVVKRDPLRLAITASGADKGRLTPDGILLVDANETVLSGTGRPAAETSLHLAVVHSRRAGAVLHTNSVWSTLLSETDAGGVAVEGYEMLKGLAGVQSHEHREWLPVLDNSQNLAGLAVAVDRTLARHPGAHGFLLRGRGLYTWGRDLDEARRHTEILEFLLEVEGRRRRRGARP